MKIKITEITINNDQLYVEYNTTISKKKAARIIKKVMKLFHHQLSELLCFDENEDDIDEWICDCFDTIADINRCIRNKLYK